MNKKLTLNITATRREELLQKHLSGTDVFIKEVVEPLGKVPAPQIKEERKPKPLPYFNRELFEEWLSMFRAAYPLAFPQEKRLPLAVGIDKEIGKILGEKGAIKEQIKGFMRWYVRNIRYLKEMNLGAARINLQGEVAGEVTAREASYAQLILARKENNRNPVL